MSCSTYLWSGPTSTTEAIDQVLCNGEASKKPFVHCSKITRQSALFRPAKSAHDRTFLDDDSPCFKRQRNSSIETSLGQHTRYDRSVCIRFTAIIARRNTFRMVSSTARQQTIHLIRHVRRRVFFTLPLHTDTCDRLKLCTTPRTTGLCLIPSSPNWACVKRRRCLRNTQSSWYASSCVDLAGLRLTPAQASCDLIVASPLRRTIQTTLHGLEPVLCRKVPVILLAELQENGAPGSFCPQVSLDDKHRRQPLRHGLTGRHTTQGIRPSCFPRL